MKDKKVMTAVISGPVLEKGKPISHQVLSASPVPAVPAVPAVTEKETKDATDK